MERLAIDPRTDWRRDCESVGFNYHSMDGVYWDESHCYRFAAEEIDVLEQAPALCINSHLLPSSTLSRPTASDSSRFHRDSPTT